MNALKQRREGPDRTDGPGDYYEVVTADAVWYVSADTAARVGRQLERWWRPRWIRFVDVNGGRAWVRADRVEAVQESTEAQRERAREFHFRQRREARAHRRWDAED